MSQLNETIQWSYRGREVQRADGKQRRLSILDATLRIISRNGVRGVRHRAIAEEANVPLSATTYYFKDIEDLIFDAFIYFVECGQKSNDALEQQCIVALEKGLSTSRSSKKMNKVSRKVFAADVAAAVIFHIGKQIKDKKNRKIEWAYKVEAVRNPQLAKLIFLAENKLLKKVQYFFEVLDDKSAEYRANMFMAAIMHFEYYLLLQSNSTKKLKALHAQITSAITDLIIT